MPINLALRRLREGDYCKFQEHTLSPTPQVHYRVGISNPELSNVQCLKTYPNSEGKKDHYEL